jgi:hypothetical protein
MSTTNTSRTAPLVAWAYLIVTTIAEMAIANNFIHINGIYNPVLIAALVTTQVIAMGAIFLRLKYEPRSIVGVAGASIFFAVLAVVLFIASLGH